MSQKIQLLVVLMLAFALTGCATIASEKKYDIAFSSMKENVSFEIFDDEGTLIKKEKAPATITLDAGSGYFSKSEYTVKWTYADGKTKTTKLKSSIDGWYFGNLVCVWPIGMLIVDPITGAMWKLPETYNDTYAAVVDKIEKEDGKKQLSFVNINSIPAQYRDKLVPVM
ncbi:hypothetical protein [Halodesulfovibrio spirochaetisodalis]|uniref:Lipoprotein n=1 Tax=Halodesulfovibrio spirochaetisodalis TaxID=1560234 RepID=A0A1B7X8Y7_9BACT|nr:hypothetical protein [Halodesulfovibrio spirochaetisodalis]OBQ45792.1 hypothetical protein SP90_15965 [Halodesulfovibrio spirochaetisodalis]